MSITSYARLFLLSLVVTATGLTTYIYFNRTASKRNVPKLVPIADGVFITSQLAPDQMRSLRFEGMRTIVDIRPDGESTDQATSQQMEFASKGQGMNFHYVPVPHKNIPDEAVKTVSDVLSRDEKPTVLYCRSGRRAVRTFALARASQSDGPAADEILTMVKTAGFSAEDLKDNIVERIAHRSTATETTNNN